jgi:proline iminopeptidase
MVQAVYLSMGRRHDYRPALKRIRAKTLVLHGANDILPESIAKSYADLIPGAKLTVLEASRTRGAAGLGHAPFSDDPQQFGQIVGEFLSSINEDRAGAKR